MSSQLTCGSKRVAKMLASRLRFTERRPLPWPFPVTHVSFLERAPVDFTRDGCVVFCRRRTTVVHSIVVGAQTDVDDAQTDVDGAQTVVDGAQTDVDGAKTDVDGAQADVNGAQTDIDGAQTDVDGAQTDVDGAQTDVDGAQTDVDCAQTNLDGTQTDVDGAQTGVDGSRTDIDGARTDVDNARTDVNGAGTDNPGMEKRANVHTAECTNLGEIKEPLYIIIYVLYNLFLYEGKALYALETNFLGYIFLLHFIVILYLYALCLRHLNECVDYNKTTHGAAKRPRVGYRPKCYDGR